MKQKNLLLFIICLLSCHLPIGCQSTFLNSDQRSELYDMMIREIEAHDAEAIHTRNITKKTNWKDFISLRKAAILEAENARELKKALDVFFSGYVNLHSRYQFLYPMDEFPSVNWKSKQELGFTYPGFHFFEMESGDKIDLINGVAIDSLFESYSDLRCRGGNKSYCAGRFISDIEGNRLIVSRDSLSGFSLENGKEVKLHYDTTSTRDRYAEIIKSIEIEDYLEDWTVVEKGYKVALLQKENIALVKIKDFVYTKGSDGGLRCSEEAGDSTQCADIQLLRRGISSIKEKTKQLIIDLQDNPGGNENSRFIAELCPAEFKDLAVQFRKAPILEEYELRQYLFYGSEKTENWYQGLKSNGTYDDVDEGAFFPAIGDFCRGSDSCKLVPIPPNPTARRDWKSISILVNEGTASSGDDFTYRLHKYGRAGIIGQPQGADLTYSVLKVLFYIDKEGNIQKKYVKNPQEDYEVAGTLLLECDIPFSRSIDDEGNHLQGNPLHLDLEVPLTPDNFKKRNQEVLQTAVNRIRSN